MMKRGEKVLDKLSLGIAAPIREAARTCQLFPPTAWPLQTYMAIGRNDLATSANETVEQFNGDGFKSRKNFLVSGVTLSRFLLEYDVDIGYHTSLVNRVLADLGKLLVISFQLQRQLGVERRML